MGIYNIDRNRLYRSLKTVIRKDYRRKISEICLNYAAKGGISLVLYDVTTLYSEVEREDGYRKPGLSKERRLEPQIVIGLLVDQDGFPLGLESFEGNTAETKTILPVINDFCRKHNVRSITVVADAAMLSAKNLTALEEAGHRYIVGSRLNKIPYDIENCQNKDNLVDGQIIETTHKNHRVIYQYREKRAQLDRQNIQKQIEKAKKVIAGKTSVSRTKFLTVTAKQKIIDYYHQLFRIEANFRMAKSDFKARPIFHRKRDSIEAHLTIVLTALAIGKSVEIQTKISIKHLVKLLRPVRAGIVVINGQEYQAEENISPDIHKLLEKLHRGH